MRKFLIAAAVAAAGFAVPASAAVGVSINIGEPGFFGRLDLGGAPPPQVVYAQPVAVERVPYDRPPIYLRVPPGYSSHWNRYCHEYNACGERVFFVRDDWYNRVYVPHYREHHPEFRNEHRDFHRDERRDERRDDRHDDRRDFDRDHH